MFPFITSCRLTLEGKTASSARWRKLLYYPLIHEALSCVEQGGVGERPIPYKNPVLPARGLLALWEILFYRLGAVFLQFLVKLVNIFFYYRTPEKKTVKLVTLSKKVVGSHFKSKYFWPFDSNMGVGFI